MKLELNGIEIEIPGDAQVDVSADGKKVTIRVPEPKETIRVVESESETIRYIPGPETIRYIEVEKPCTKPHYPTWQYWHSPYTYPYTSPNWTVTSGTTVPDNSTYTICGSAVSNLQSGSTNVCNNLNGGLLESPQTWTTGTASWQGNPSIT
jgi:hypothetical protein